MIVLAGVLFALMIIAIVIGLIGLLIAYNDGKDGGYRTRYSNGYIMPWAWFYNLGYLKTRGKSRLTTAQKNRQRFFKEE